MKRSAKGKARRPACDTYQGQAVCDMDEHCMYVVPGGPCRSKSDYKRKGIKEGLRASRRPVAKPKSEKRVAAGKKAAGKNSWLVALAKARAEGLSGMPRKGTALYARAKALQ